MVRSDDGHRRTNRPRRRKKRQGKDSERDRIDISASIMVVETYNILLDERTISQVMHALGEKGISSSLQPAHEISIWSCLLLLVQDSRVMASTCVPSFHYTQSTSVHHLKGRGRSGVNWAEAAAAAAPGMWCKSGDFSAQRTSTSYVPSY